MRDPDRLFADPELAPLYDVFDDDRGDLDVYTELIVGELDARSILDVGCGTGSLPIRLLAEGQSRELSLSIIGVDPASASLDVARAKPRAEHVRWIHGTAVDAAASERPIEVDLVAMVGNVAQVFVDDADWHANLDAITAMLRPGGQLVFETRDPARRAWEEWTPERSMAVRDVDGVGRIIRWTEVTDVDLPCVTFATVFEFVEQRRRITSSSTLRFRSRDELSADLADAGLDVTDVRDAPDRPGREWVFIATRG